MDNTPPEAPPETPAETAALLPLKSNQPTYWSDHRLLLLIIGTVTIALIMTSISMVAYTQSGAAQLDLSRPGYKSVSDKVDKEDKVNGFDATGQVNKETIQEFMTIYDEQSQKAKSVDAFNGDPLNPELVF